MEPQKTLNSQSNLEKDEQNWRHHTACFQTTLQSYSNQNSRILAEKQTHRSIEQNRESKNKLKINLQIQCNPYQSFNDIFSQK